MKQALLEYNEKTQEYHVKRDGESKHACKKYRDAWRFVNGLLISGEIESIDNKVVPEQSVFIKK